MADPNLDFDEVRIELPFIVADAALGQMLTVMWAEPPLMTWQWRGITYGSSQHILKLNRKKDFVVIHLYAASLTVTLMDMEMPELAQSPQYQAGIRALLQKFAEQIVGIANDAAGIPFKSDQAAIREELSKFASLQNTEPKQPRANAPLERWLAWRDEMAVYGRRVSLADIAKESGHSLSTLKKRSAERGKDESG